MSSPINKSPYDNDNTLLYKQAIRNNVPVNLIVAQPISREEGYSYSPLEQYIEQMLGRGEQPADIFALVKRLNRYITPEDFLYTYGKVLFKQQLPEAKLVELFNKLNKEIVPEEKDEDDEEEEEEWNAYPDRMSIEAAYKAWVSKNQGRIRDTIARHETIERVQSRLAELERYPEILTSPVKYSSKVFAFAPRLAGKTVVIDDGLDLFNQAQVSVATPFLRYQDEKGNIYTRIYTGTRIDDQPNYNNIIPILRKNERSVLYLTLWLGDPNSPFANEMGESPADDFTTVIYYLDRNYLTIEVVINPEEKKGLLSDPNQAFARVEAAFPGLKLGQSEEVNIKAGFDLWNFSINESYFLDQVLCEAVISVYLYMEEKIKPFALKERLDLHYRPIYSDALEDDAYNEDPYFSNPATISLSLTQRSIIQDQSSQVVQGNRVTTQMWPPGTPYLHISVTQGRSERELLQFLPIFNLLMRHYVAQVNRPPEVNDLLAAYSALPQLTQLEGLIQKKKSLAQTETDIFGQVKRSRKIQRKAKESIINLTKRAPELFQRNYSRACQSDRQPLIIEPNEVEAWTNRLVEIGQRLEKRKVMRYPKEGASWYFVCPDDTLPNPGLTINRELRHVEGANPLVPCCFAQDSTGPGSNYDKYMKGEPIVVEPGAKGDKPLVTAKVLAPYRLGVLAQNVGDVLKSYSEDSAQILRYGVVFSPNSLLHCLCVAVDDPDYLRLEDDEEREDYVERLRTYLALQVNPALLRQELFDYSEEEIRNYLQDTESYLDPAIYYRVIEELYQVNLYCFGTVEKDPTGVIDLPRYKLFHARPLRLDRPTVVIFKNRGSESDTLVHPQCELVVDYNTADKRREVTKVFGPEMTRLCHSVLEKSLTTLSVGFEIDSNFSLQQNLYYYLDHLRLIPLRAQGQIIDENGKLRVLLFEGPLILYTLPSAPENLPLISLNDLPQTGLVSLETALKLFPSPSAVSRDGRGRVTGLWIKVFDVELAEYVPVEPGQYKMELTHPAPLLFNIGYSQTDRLRRLKRAVNIIQQLLRWLFQLALRQKIIEVEDFLIQNSLVDTRSVKDSSIYYDFSRLPRKIPQERIVSLATALEYVSEVAPTLVQRGKIIFYNQPFREKMKSMLMEYYELISGSIYGEAARRLPTVLDNYYLNPSDFSPVPHTKLFVSEDDFRFWLEVTRGPNVRDFPISSKAAGGKLPVLYRDKNGILYFIQGTAQESRLAALAVAYTWYYYHVNVGYFPIELGAIPAHMVYGIGDDQHIYPIKDETKGQDSYLRILYQGVNIEEDRLPKFSALLDVV